MLAVTTDASGAGEVSFTVPKVAARTYVVFAVGGGDPDAAASLIVS